MSRTQCLICVSLIIVIVAVGGFAIGWYAHKDLYPGEDKWCMFAKKADAGVDNS